MMLIGLFVMAHAIDHVGLGCADLEKGIAFVEQETSVRAEIGGVHPGRGTRNALLSLGGGAYLEIIAPVAGGKPEGDAAELGRLATPTPVFFAVRSEDLDATARTLKESGFAISEIRPGSRKRPDGSVLEWRTLGLSDAALVGVAPFFIEWKKSSPHPSATSPSGCTLKALEVEDPSPETLSKLFAVLGLEIPTKKAPKPALRLTISCPKGSVTF
jgi:catechol 2,3-dioxygenase-like lactoylglutathione lyase family enzyme